MMSWAPTQDRADYCSLCTRLFQTVSTFLKSLVPLPVRLLSPNPSLHRQSPRLLHEESWAIWSYSLDFPPPYLYIILHAQSSLSPLYLLLTIQEVSPLPLRLIPLPSLGPPSLASLRTSVCAPTLPWLLPSSGQTGSWLSLKDLV